MKRILLTTRATATIEESWFVTVPDTWTEDDDPQELIDGELTFIQDRTIGDEENRTVIAWQLMDENTDKVWLI